MTNRSDAALPVPPTSREVETAKDPLIEITNGKENASLYTALPSTSRGIYN